MKKDKLSWKEGLRLNGRAARLLWKNYPQVFISDALKEVFSTLIPFVNIWFSARIIGELAGARNRETLIYMILILLLANLLLSVLRAAFVRWNETALWVAYRSKETLFDEKLLSMDFATLDDSHTRDLFLKIKQNESWSDWGFPRMLRYAGSLVKAVIGICGTLALTWNLFLLQVPEGAGGLSVLNSPVVNIVMIALMFAAVILSPAISKKSMDYWTNYSEEARFGNRIFTFYTYYFGIYERRRALDARMYRQDIICRNNMEKGDMFGIKSPIAALARGPMGMLSVAADMVSRIFTGAVYLFVCIKAWAGAFGVGEVTQYISAITMLYGSLALFLRTVGEMQTNASFVKDILNFLDIPDDMYKGSLTVEKRNDCKYEVEFCNVSFRYPNTEEYALKNVSLRFRIGEKLAVVGENGSGKTTLIKLLCRLYDPTEGEIRLNGIDIRKYDYKEYMSVFSVVFQDFALFAFSLGQNVAATEQYDEIKVKKCLKEAGLEERITCMKSGLETYLYKDFDEEGVEISGGEAQKIAIARALYKNAGFLILDEPTAALDPVAEYEIYTKFGKIVGGRTAIYISHRLASCRFCDEIVVFDKGRICQRGNHENLLADTGGKYYALWNAQAQYYKSPAAAMLNAETSGIK